MTLAQRYAHTGLDREQGGLLVRRQRAAQRTLQRLGPFESGESDALSCGVHLAIRDALDALDERGARGEMGERAGPVGSILSIGLIAQRGMMSGLKKA